MNYYHCKGCEKYLGNKKKLYCSPECEPPKEKPIKIAKLRKNASLREELLKDVKLQVFERSKGICEDCNQRAAEAIHHLFLVREYPCLQHELANLIHICKPCHRLRHPELPEILFM